MSDFDTWLTNWRAGIPREKALDPNQRAALEALADFSERHRSIPSSGDVDLWGFGTAQMMARPVEGGWWVCLHDLTEATGIGHRELQTAFLEALDRDEGEADTIEWRNPEDDEHHLDLVRHDFVMRLFAERSPWRREFFENTADLMAHAILKSGLADQLGGVVRITGDGTGNLIATATGETLADVLRSSKLPSEEVARHRACLGPAAALQDGGL
ncbi:hypothetical protein [Streptomyces sp. NPDC051994]|uniref:hypothetical protein n=1 Tax=Streptomyces sp. NPDC051994 TaxID=3155287 RepID=UPI00343B49F3